LNDAGRCRCVREPDLNPHAHGRPSVAAILSELMVATRQVSLSASLASRANSAMARGPNSTVK
jgi:hypothetical protein